MESGRKDAVPDYRLQYPIYSIRCTPLAVSSFALCPFLDGLRQKEAAVDVKMQHINFEPGKITSSSQPPMTQEIQLLIGYISFLSKVQIPSLMHYKSEKTNLQCGQERLSLTFHV